MVFTGTTQDFILQMYGPVLERPCVEVQQADTASRTVRFHLKTFKDQDYEIPYGAMAVVCVKKADGKRVLNDCEIEDQSTILVTFSTQSVACAGKQMAQIYIFTEDGDIKTRSFCINVPEAVYSDDAIKSMDETGILIDMIEKTSQYLGKAEEASLAAAKANAAAAEAKAAAAACEGIVDGMNVMIDDVDARAYRLGVSGGKMYYEEVETNET